MHYRVFYVSLNCTAQVTCLWGNVRVLGKLIGLTGLAQLYLGHSPIHAQGPEPHFSLNQGTPVPAQPHHISASVQPCWCPVPSLLPQRSLVSRTRSSPALLPYGKLHCSQRAASWCGALTSGTSHVSGEECEVQFPNGRAGEWVKKKGQIKMKSLKKWE